jgi:hypothetical protein
MGIRYSDGWFLGGNQDHEVDATTHYTAAEGVSFTIHFTGEGIFHLTKIRSF